MSAITDLRCEYQINPLGIDVTEPRLSWRMQSDRAGARQTAYRLLAASAPDLLRAETPDLWDSGRIDSDQSIHVVYQGAPLVSRQRVHWVVTVWDEMGNAVTSEPAWFEMGLLGADDWRASWIGGSLIGGPRTSVPAPYLRRSFSLPGTIESARLYITALGLYECSINGQVVHDDVFAPGWTDYAQRVQYRVYDVTDLLKTGENAIGVVLGDGWAVGFVGLVGRQVYARQPQLLAQLEVTLDEGHKILIHSDSRWRYEYGPLLENDMLMGEAYDARLETLGWDRPGFDDSCWRNALPFNHPEIDVVATTGPVVRRIKELTPVGEPAVERDLLFQRILFDLGQNMVGRVRFKGSAPAGTTITLRFAEALDEEGGLYIENLRAARATDYYTFKGDGVEIWEPKFTFHGFRYVELSGYPGELADDTITGVALHSDMPQTGHFSTSNPLLNQLQHNILWGMKGNFVDVPTDCPQRDERLGWTGDIQIFARTAAFNMDVAGFLTRWLQNVADAQGAQGEVPAVAPNVLPMWPDGGPAWADAIIICSWTLYLCYGDVRILAQQYTAMTRFMDFLLRTSPNFIRCAPDYEGWPGFGDWLSINADTPRDLIGTAFLAYDATLMAQIAETLGKEEDAAAYRRLFVDVKQAFADRYLKGGAAVAGERRSEARAMMDAADAISHGNLKQVDYGPVASDVFNTNLFAPTQTAYVLALHFDLLPDDLRPLAVAELAADIGRRDMHLSTGFVGAPYLLHALSDNGRLDTAYALLNQTSWPSWLYSVTQGATTIWERWDGWTEENGFQSAEMNSFNHYAYGSVGDWLYSAVAGIEIDPVQPAYKHAILRPQPGGGLTYARGLIDTPFGELLSDWSLAEGSFSWTVKVPPNTTATATLPTSATGAVTVDGQPVDGLTHTLKPGLHRLVADTHIFQQMERTT